MQEPQLKGEAHSISYGRRLQVEGLVACATREGATLVNMYKKIIPFLVLSCALHVALICYFQLHASPPPPPLKPNKALVHTVYLKPEAPKPQQIAKKVAPAVAKVEKKVTPVAAKAVAKSAPTKVAPTVAKAAKKVDTPKAVKGAAATPSAPLISHAYAEEIAMQLKLLLSLPDYGAVQVRLILGPTGEVTKVEILSSQSTANEKYLLSTLPTVKLPAPPNGETPLKLTLSNA